MSKLTAKDIKRFEQRLRQRRTELRDRIREGLLDAKREDYIELAGRVHDVGEESVAELLTSVNLTILDREVDELRDVENALERIRDDSYGKCQECGGDIERERLEAYPTAKRCIEDQRRYEVRRAGGHDQTPSL